MIICKWLFLEITCQDAGHGMYDTSKSMSMNNLTLCLVIKNRLSICKLNIRLMSRSGKVTRDLSLEYSDFNCQIRDRNSTKLS